MTLTALQTAQRNLRIYDMERSGMSREQVAGALGLPLHVVARVVQSYREDKFGPAVRAEDVRSGLFHILNRNFYRPVPDRSNMTSDEALDYDEMVEAVQRFSARYYISAPQRVVIGEIDAQRKREMRAAAESVPVICPPPPIVACGFYKQTCVE